MKRTILIGCNYTAADGSDQRHEPGDVVDDLPASVASALEEMGALSPAEGLAFVLTAEDHMTAAVAPVARGIETLERKFKTRGEREGQE